MRLQKRSPWLAGLGVVLAVLALSGARAGADISSDKPGSVVVFPKVIADGTRDTLISLTNTSNMEAYAHCQYVLGTGFCSISGNICSTVFDCTGGVGDVCETTWQLGNFDIILTHQQPTIWRVSTGRVFDPTLEGSGMCETFVGMPAGALRQSCPGFFFTTPNDTGGGVGVPPPPGSPYFRGELKCFQVDQDGGLLGADSLKGEATIETIGSAEISTYNSINIRSADNSAENPSVADLNGVEYNACPEALEFTHYAAGASNFVAEGLNASACAMSGCPVRTEITVVPCTENFAEPFPEEVAVAINATDEFENPRSSGFTLTCWANVDTSDFGAFSPLGSTILKTRLSTPQGASGRCRDGENRGATCSSDTDCGAGGVCAPNPGILAVFEQFYDTDASLGLTAGSVAAGSAAANAALVDLDHDPNDPDPIGRTGRCRGDLAKECETDADCDGLCRKTGAACTMDSDCTGGALDVCDRCLNDEMTLNPDILTSPPQVP
jgi:hypothetical protein